MSKNNETIVDEVSIDDRDLRVYEVSYLLVPTMTEDKAQAKSEDIKKSIATLGGSFISEETPYLRELSYEMVRVIKNVNNRFETAYFGWIKFESEGKTVQELNNILKLDEDVIRYLIVKADRNVDIFTKKETLTKEEAGDMVNIDTSTEEVPAEEVPAEVIPEIAEIEETK